MTDRPTCLLVGEDAPGSLLSSIAAGVADAAITTVLNPRAGATAIIDMPGLSGAVRRRLAARHAESRLVETVRQLRPDLVVLVKGRGIGPAAITAMRDLGARVGCWYPDNPFWSGGDPGAAERLAACDVPVLWSERQASLFSTHNPSVSTLAFGYNPDWYPLADPSPVGRDGIVFLGTWSRRRERFLAALDGLPLTVAGTGWVEHGSLEFATPPIRESEAGRLLRGAVVGVNLLHPQCAGAHNMRTREICASGALQLTDPGVDGTPLRDGVGARWFHSPDHLRELASAALADPARSAALAAEGQQLIAWDTYRARGRELVELCRAPSPPRIRKEGALR